eukprot:ANDGO_07711.mRNA.1 hypothetical protein
MSICLCGVAHESTVESIQSFFGIYGSIVDVTLDRVARTACVEFANPDSASSVVRDGPHFHLDGSTVSVNACPAEKNCVLQTEGTSFQSVLKNALLWNPAVRLQVFVDFKFSAMDRFHAAEDFTTFVEAVRVSCAQQFGPCAVTFVIYTEGSLPCHASSLLAMPDIVIHTVPKNCSVLIRMSADLSEWAFDQRMGKGYKIAVVFSMNRDTRTLFQWFRSNSQNFGIYLGLWQANNADSASPCCFESMEAGANVLHVQSTTEGCGLLKEPSVRIPTEKQHC